MLTNINKNIYSDESKKLYGYKTSYPTLNLKGFLYVYVKKLFY